MSDRQVICQWMGWPADAFEQSPTIEHLGLLYGVEARLTNEQQWQYIEALRGTHNMPTWHFLHAAAPTRIKALVAVLREAKHA